MGVCVCAGGGGGDNSGKLSKEGAQSGWGDLVILMEPTVPEPISEDRHVRARIESQEVWG